MNKSSITGANATATITMNGIELKVAVTKLSIRPIMRDVSWPEFGDAIVDQYLERYEIEMTGTPTMHNIDPSNPKIDPKIMEQFSRFIKLE